jgi:raffinose/stachyose/melibiose transport system permease protein
MHKVLSNKAAIFLLVFPGMLLFLFAIFVPIVLSMYYGMTDYSGIGAAKFIGLQNFTNIISRDETFWISLRNASLLALGLVFIQHPLCITFAIMLDRVGGMMEKFLRVIFFIPCVISIVVTSKMWVVIFDPEFGLLNKILGAIGLGFLKQQWLGNPKTALLSILFILIWQGFGWGLLIYYAGLKGIAEELYEAAKIDGARGLRLYSNITLPLLSPVIKVNVTLAIISALKQMEAIFLTTNGGPGQSTQFLANYLYIKAFNNYQYGYANAISVLFVIICLAATVLSNKLIKNKASEI